MAKILVVEDDEQIAINVRDFLTDENHVVDVVYNASDANFRLDTYQYEVIVLDIILPDGSGFEICRRYRSKGGSARVIMLTGQTEIEEKEQGLDSGADDYLTKPFHPRELAARIRSLMRRQAKNKHSSNLLKIRNIQLDPNGRSVLKNGIEIDLLPKEFDLLEFMMRAPGEIFSQEALLDRVWESSSDASLGTVRVHIRKLREKLDDKGSESLIKTIHRQGYKLEPEG